MRLIQYRFIIWYLVSMVVDGANFIRTAVNRNGEFELAKNDHIHSLNHYEEHKVEDVEHCFDKCLENSDCKSVNYQYYLGDQGNTTGHEDEEKHTCQLVGYDRSLNPTYNLSEGWHNYDSGGYSRYTRIKSPDSKTLYYYSGYLGKQSIFSTRYVRWFDYDAATGALRYIKEGTFLDLTSYSFGARVMFYSRQSSYTDLDQRFRRYFNGNIRFGKFCLVLDGPYMELGNCGTFNWNLIGYVFNDLDRGPVRVTVYRNLGDITGKPYIYAHSNFQNRAYTEIGYQDDIHMVQSNFCEHCVFLLQGIFVPKVSGQYRFYIVCDDLCDLHIGTNEKESSRKYIISAANTAPWNFQNPSNAVYLKAGAKYYVEGLLWEREMTEHMHVGVKFPDDDYIRSIERDLLQPFN